MRKINLPQKCFVTLTELQGNSCNVISMFPVMLMGCLWNEAAMETFRAHLKTVPSCCARTIPFLIRRLFSPQVHWRRTVLLTRGPCWAFARAQAPQGESTSGGEWRTPPTLLKKKKIKVGQSSFFTLSRWTSLLTFSSYMIQGCKPLECYRSQSTVDSDCELMGSPSFIFSSALRLCWASLVFSM